MVRKSAVAVPGIYEIICNATGAMYVGSAKDMEYRFKAHKQLLRRGAHYNRYLQRAWNKYGESSFSFEPYLRLLIDDQPLRFSLEEQVIRKWKPKFNAVIAVTKAGGGGLEGKQHTEEARKKMRLGQLRYVERRRALGGPWNTPETIEKMKASAAVRKISAAGRKSLSEAAKRRKRTYKQVCKKGLHLLTGDNRTKHNCCRLCQREYKRNWMRQKRKAMKANGP